VNNTNLILNPISYRFRVIAQHWSNCRCWQGYTRCSAIAERPRCRVRYSFRQK